MFTNTKLASLDVEKETVGGTATFGYTVDGSGLSGFNRNTAVNNPTQSSPFDFTAAEFGTKFVTETTQSGWTLTDIVCTAGGAEITIGTGTGAGFAQGATAGFDAGDTTVKAVIDAGDTPSCVFTNTKLASLDVEKETVGGTATFGYTVDGSGLSAFNRNTAVNNPTQSSPFDFTAAEFGTKFVTETTQSGWTLTDIVCTAGGAEITIGTGTGAGFAQGATAGFDAGDTTVKAVIDAGDTPSCVFTNTKLASLDVEKETVGGTATFGYTVDGSGLSGFNRNTAVNNPTQSSPFDFTAAEFGTKFVTETTQSGWTLTDIVCTAGGAEITIGTGTGAGFAQGATAGFDAGDTTVKAVIGAGDTPSCVFTNTKLASLDVEKETVGGTATFGYTVDGSGLSGFNRNTAVNNPTQSSPFDFTAAEFGTKFVTETTQSGWTLTDIVCTAGGAEITIGTGTGAGFAQGATAGFDAGDTTVKAVIGAGDTPSCVFTNTKLASLDVEKETVGGTATFGYTVDGSGLSGFNRNTAVNNPTQSSPFDFTAAEFGTKFVTETTQSGWTLTDIVCTAGGAEITIGTGTGAGFAQGATAGFDAGDTTVKAVIGAGDTPSCVFTNTKLASLDVEKETVGGTATFGYTVDGSGLSGFNRNTAVNNPTQSSPFDFTAAEFGTKFVTETTQSGWTLTDIVCTAGGAEITIGTGTGAGFAQGATAGFDAGDTTVKAVIGAGDTPSCVFTNTKLASLDVEKETVGGTATFGYTVDGSGLSGFNRNTAVNNPTQSSPFDFTAAEFGTKFVTETTQSGWTLTDIVCTAGGAEITIGTGTGGGFAQGATAGFDAGDTTVKAVIGAGDTPSCVFTNTKNASLDIEKETVGSTATFGYTVDGSGLSGFNRNTAVNNPTVNAPFAFSGFQLGTKYVQETAEAGWTLTNIVCTAGGAEILSAPALVRASPRGPLRASMLVTPPSRPSSEPGTPLVRFHQHTDPVPPDGVGRCHEPGEHEPRVHGHGEQGLRRRRGLPAAGRGQAQRERHRRRQPGHRRQHLRHHRNQRRWPVHGDHHLRGHRQDHGDRHLRRLRGR